MSAGQNAPACLAKMRQLVKKNTSGLIKTRPVVKTSQLIKISQMVKKSQIVKISQMVKLSQLAKINRLERAGPGLAPARTAGPAAHGVFEQYLRG